MCTWFYAEKAALSPVITRVQRYYDKYDNERNLSYVFQKV